MLLVVVKPSISTFYVIQDNGYSTGGIGRYLDVFENCLARTNISLDETSVSSYYLPDGRKLRVVDVFLLSMMPKEDKKNFMEVMELPMEIGAH